MAYPVKKQDYKKTRHKLTVVKTDLGQKKGRGKLRKVFSLLRPVLALSLIFVLSTLLITRYENIKLRSQAIVKTEALIKRKEGERDYHLQVLAPYVCEKVIEEKAMVNLGMVKPRKDQIVHIALKESQELTKNSETLTERVREFFARMKTSGEGV